MASHQAGEDGVARTAVLQPSATVASSAVPVQGINFDDYQGRDVTVAELLTDMSCAGFQASAVGDAVRIINGMVCRQC